MDWDSYTLSHLNPKMVKMFEATALNVDVATLGTWIATTVERGILNRDIDTRTDQLYAYTRVLKARLESFTL